MFFFVSWICIISSYSAWDMEMMIKRRGEYYRVRFFFNGFIDLHTDIFFVFWKDLFTKDPQKDAIDTEENGE